MSLYWLSRTRTSQGINGMSCVCALARLEGVEVGFKVCIVAVRVYVCMYARVCGYIHEDELIIMSIQKHILCSTYRMFNSPIP